LDTKYYGLSFFFKKKKTTTTTWSWSAQAKIRCFDKTWKYQIQRHSVVMKNKIWVPLQYSLEWIWNVYKA
jgi:hypothetical protein